MTSELLALAGAAGALSLANSLHCLGMCGAFALTARARPEWHLGRAATYVTLGALGGAAGQAAFGPRVHLVGAALASLVLLGMTLRLGGWLPPLPSVPTGPLRLLPALLRRAATVPGRSPTLARFALGATGSLVPCGVVYGGLALALVAGNAASGALVMASFALGTLPALGLLALGGRRVAAVRASPGLRRVGALAALVLGLGSLWWRAPTEIVMGRPAPEEPACHAAP